MILHRLESVGAEVAWQSSRAHLVAAPESSRLTDPEGINQRRLQSVTSQK